MRSDFGRTLVAVGDNPRTAELSGVRVWRARTIAFVLSGLAAAVAAILLGGYSGVSFQAGAGLEFGAITAVVLGGVALGGGRGSVVGAMLGALTLETAVRPHELLRRLRRPQVRPSRARSSCSPWRSSSIAFLVQIKGKPSVRRSMAALAAVTLLVARRLCHRRAGRRPRRVAPPRPPGRAPGSSRSSSCRPTTTTSSRCSTPPRPGPADKPWEQALNPTMVDTAKFKKPGPYKICFSNAALNNPWRQVGFKTMQAEVEAHEEPDQGVRPRRRRRQGPEADRRHQRPARQGLRRAHRLAEHHRHAHPGRRGGLPEGPAGHRLRPWRQHEVPGDVHQPHRRLRLRPRRRPSSSARR